MKRIRCSDWLPERVRGPNESANDNKTLYQDCSSETVSVHKSVVCASLSGRSDVAEIEKQSKITRALSRNF